MKKTYSTFIITILFFIFLIQCREGIKSKHQDSNQFKAGELCETNSECESWICFNNICINELGKECKKDNHCLSLICEDDLCVECREKDDCDSDLYCYNGECKEFCPSGEYKLTICLPEKPRLPECLLDGDESDCIGEWRNGCPPQVCKEDESGWENECPSEVCKEDDIEKPEPPRFQDWVCAENWLSVPIATINRWN